MGTVSGISSGDQHMTRGIDYSLVAVILAATFMQLLDVSIVNVAIPAIQANLDASFGAIELVVAGYQLTFAVTLITASRLGDAYGRKRLFVVGMAGFTLASAICGAAPNSTALIIARLAQGLFSGLMFPQVLSIIQVSFEGELRSRVFGIYGAVIGLATVTGPLAGGLLIKANIWHLDWRLIFYVNVPIGLLALLGATRRLSESRSSQRPEVDYRGALIATTGLSMLIFPLLEGRELGWPAWMKVMAALSLLVLVVFGLQQVRASRRSKETLVNVELVASRGFLSGLALFLVFFLGVAPFFFALLIFLQDGNGFTPLVAGLTSAPFAIGAILASLLSTRFRPSLAKVFMLAGSFLLIVAMVLLIVLLGNVAGQLSGYRLVPALLLAGVGLGLFVGPASALLMVRVKASQTGSASGLIATFQQIGGALGVALISLVFFSFLGYNAPGSARSQLPVVTNELKALAIPQSFIAEGESAFVTCIHDRANAKNLNSLPESCLIIGGAIEQAPIAAALKAKLIALFISNGNDAAGSDFLLSLRETLGYEIAVFTVAVVLTLAMPGWPRAEENQALPIDASNSDRDDASRSD